MHIQATLHQVSNINIPNIIRLDPDHSFSRTSLIWRRLWRKVQSPTPPEATCCPLAGYWMPSVIQGTMYIICIYKMNAMSSIKVERLCVRGMSDCTCMSTCCSLCRAFKCAWGDVSSLVRGAFVVTGYLSFNLLCCGSRNRNPSLLQNVQRQQPRISQNISSVRFSAAHHLPYYRL